LKGGLVNRKKLLKNKFTKLRENNQAWQDMADMADMRIDVILNQKGTIKSLQETIFICEDTIEIQATTIQKLDEIKDNEDKIVKLYDQEKHILTIIFNFSMIMAISLFSYMVIHYLFDYLRTLGI